MGSMIKYCPICEKAVEGTLITYKSRIPEETIFRCVNNHQSLMKPKEVKSTVGIIYKCNGFYVTDNKK